MRDESGRVVAITGAGKGLGAAFARAWSAQGARVVVNNRARAGEPSSAEAVAAELRAAGGDAIADTHAVDAPGAAEALIGRTLDAYGRIDALILNAGISGPVRKIGADGDGALREVMAINFFANVALVEAALPHLAAAPAGRLLFVSSAAGLHGLRGRAAYAASKGAVNAYALSLAHEVRRTALGVNILCPYAATGMTGGVDGDEDPLLDPANAAPAAVWLTSAGCTLSGEIILAGAGRARRARTLESASAASADGCADLAPTRAFTGAEAAFADFYADARHV